jgi:hypothetical protein
VITVLGAWNLEEGGNVTKTRSLEADFKKQKMNEIVACKLASSLGSVGGGDFALALGVLDKDGHGEEIAKLLTVSTAFECWC